ncbi:MAG: HEAT repeat domain-containing protein [Pyrinomonadaceae bacterium]
MTRRHGAKVTRRVPHLTKEWRHFTAGAILFLAVCIFGHNLAAQTGITSDWPETEARLIRQLYGDTEQKRSALFEIRNFRNEQASRLAVKALSDPAEIVRATAASSVVFLPEPEAANVLVPLLDDKLPFVRREAAYALGVVGHWSATDRLETLAVRDKDQEVRTTAVIAIGNIGDLDGINVLVEILKGKQSDKDEMLRRSAARSIGQIAQIIRTGKRSVLTPQNFLPDKYKDTGESEIANTSVQLQFIYAVAVLTQVLKSKNESNDTRREAAFALGEIGSTPAVSVLRSHLKSPDPYLAEICKEALLKIEKSELIHTLQ